MQSSTKFKILSIVYLIITLGVYIINSLNIYGVDGVVFKNSMETLENRHPSLLTPNSFVFSVVWAVIYFLQAGFLAYVIVNTFFRKKYKDDENIYKAPVSWQLLVLEITVNLLNVLWLIVWDREKTILALLIIIAYTAVSAIELHWLLRDFNKYRHAFNKKDVWTLNIFVFNGAGVRLAWLIIATNLNLDSVLHENADVTKVVSAIICLGVCFVLILGYLFVDYSYEHHTRFVIGPYIIWAFAFIFVYTNEKTKNTDPLLNALKIPVMIVTIVMLVGKCGISLACTLLHKNKFKIRKILHRKV